MKKRIRIYVDMDGVLCDYKKRYKEMQNDLIRLPQTIYGFYTSLEPIPGAIEAYKWMVNQGFDVRILTAPSIENPLCYTEKRVWVEKYLGMDAVRNTIISKDKTIFIGDFLIDDHEQEGGEGEFQGELILFENWDKTINYLKTKIYV